MNLANTKKEGEKNIFRKVKEFIKKSPKDSIVILSVAAVLIISTILIIYSVSLPESKQDVEDKRVFDEDEDDVPDTPPSDERRACSSNSDCNSGEFCSSGFCTPRGSSGGGGGSGGSSGGGSGGDGGGGAGDGGGSGGAGPSCGDGVCEEGEDENSCPQDCFTEETMPDNPNILIILTDDQRFDAVENIKIDQDNNGDLDDYVMPIVKREIYDRGVVFTNAIVSTPLCCPMRASLYAGGFPASQTGVIANDPPIGGAVFFKQKDSLFEQVQRHNGGIKTSLIGKWLNGFHTGTTSDKSDTGVKKPINILVPSGLDYFLAEDNTNNWRFYELVEYDSDIESVNGKGVGDIVEFGGEVTCNDGWDNDQDGLIDGADSDCLLELSCKDGKDNNDNGLIDCQDPDCMINEEGQCVTIYPGKYNMQLHKEKVIEKIDEFSQNNGQFFIVLAAQQPHSPATPEFQSDIDKVTNYVYDSPNYNEASKEDISDKPIHIQQRASGFNQESQDEIQDFFRDQLASLQSVDRAVEDIIQHLNDIGQLDNTIIIFTSDNGYEIGGHGLTHKDSPYESTRVPLAIRIPGVSPKVVNDFVVVNEDLPATFYSILGITAPTNGIDLTTSLLGTGGARKEVKIEDYNSVGKLKESGNKKGTLNKGGIEWRQLLNFDWKYTEWATGEKELYDQKNDPYELFNLLSDGISAEEQTTINQLSSKLDATYTNVVVKEPTSTEMPTEIILNQQFSYQFETMWGQGPFIWSVFDGHYTADDNSEIIRTGTLPPGMSLSEIGLLNGAPTVCGTYVFSVIVEDSFTSERFIGEVQNGRGIKEFMFIITDQNGNPC